VRSQEPRIHEAAEDGALQDFPLHPGAHDVRIAVAAAAPDPDPAPATEAETRTTSIHSAAPLSSRWTAAAADAALVLLLTAIAILAARWLTGSTPSAAGILWAAAFLVFLSFFAVVPALMLFGRTVGMALADLTVRSEEGAAGVDAAEASRRWIGTLATAATAGLPLIWTASDADAPTPADRLSGRALTVD
jgi:hypothetical protein